jgi:hypothetical protein
MEDLGLVEQPQKEEDLVDTTSCDYVYVYIDIT